MCPRKSVCSSRNLQTVLLRLANHGDRKIARDLVDLLNNTFPGLNKCRIFIRGLQDSESLRTNKTRT